MSPKLIPAWIFAKCPKLHKLLSSPDYQAKIEEKLRELAAEKPDFRYSPADGITLPCFYSKEQQDQEKNDGCIFGQAFQRLGVPKDELELQSCAIGEVVRYYSGSDAPENWTAVQFAQDHGKTWAEAVEML